jgi:hypothetical protein
MPVKIGQINIVANIATDGPGKGPKGPGAAAGGGQAGLSDEARQRIIEEAVQQVMDILQRQNER